MIKLNNYLKHKELFKMSNCEAKREIKERIKKNKNFSFSLNEYLLYDFFFYVIMPYIEIYHNTKPFIFMENNISLKKEWCRFDKVFKSKKIIVKISDNKVKLISDSDNTYDFDKNIEKVDFYILSRHHLIFFNKKEGD